MKKLKVLNISSNRITIIEGIFTLRRLEELNLSHNNISQLPRDFRWMSSLKSLFLNHNKIAQLENLDSISCLQLIKLNIENNYVCKVPGFRKYVQTHFKWLDSLDRKPISHRNV
jgi:Leucine-rich repeat (LRR) protein